MTTESDMAQHRADLSASIKGNEVEHYQLSVVLKGLEEGARGETSFSTSFPVIVKNEKRYISLSMGDLMEVDTFVESFASGDNAPFLLAGVQPDDVRPIAFLVGTDVEDCGDMVSVSSRVAASKDG